MNLKNERDTLRVCISTTYGGSDCPEIDIFGDLIEINENEIILNPDTLNLRCDVTKIISAKRTYFESGKIIAEDVYSLWLAE